MKLDEKIMEVIDEKIDKLTEEIVDQYDKPTVPELFICFQHYAIELAIQGDCTEEEFMYTTKKIWDLIKKETDLIKGVVTVKKLDKTLN